MHGGPALHIEDLDLFAPEQLGVNNLVTIRKGEMVYLPLSKVPHQADHEFVKIQGRGGEWSCTFFDRLSSTCTVYDKRPVACRLLKCWDTEDILNISGKRLLSRFDIIEDADPMLAFIRHHEKVCPIPPLNDILVRLNSSEQRDRTLEELEKLVNMDMRLRILAARENSLTMPQELFYLGRPVFQLLVPMGITYKETPAGLSLYFDNL